MAHSCKTACGVANCRGGKTSIGAVLMDQKRIAGIGTIYRAEILYKARVHPEQSANTLGRAAFERIWHHSVNLLHRGVMEGSILTLDPDDQRLHPHRRRYVYNMKSCLHCKSNIKAWKMKSRTCYACTTCQPLFVGSAVPVITHESVEHDVQLFKSRCAPEANEERKEGKGKEEQSKKKAKKTKMETRTKTNVKSKKRKSIEYTNTNKRMRSAKDAALDKIIACEGRNVEHVALVDEESLATIQKANNLDTCRKDREERKKEAEVKKAQWKVHVQ
jgi:hypothetical protein